ncbi:hypothetical protein [Pseudomonas sp. GM80]|jgi:GH24 family phage-related lysozyme (muramidase)|uniref:hypothetical protein n=1 Tax=Pseudomonas sp. GM80 TaxID=1144339 RepID=UPI00026F4DFF|nr:hypothetical protein [Pseudomonas sp. GM80]EJN36322.1 hypothetical protein PMI37_00104 [Pseudomonas sp. GM80]
MKLITKPIKSTDENICGASFSYSGTPNGVEVAIGSQPLTFSAFQDRDYASAVSGVFALGTKVGNTTMQLDARTAINFSVSEISGSKGPESDNTTVAVVLLQDAVPLFTKSYSLRVQDESGAYVDTKESGVYSGAGFSITMPTRRQGSYVAVLKSTVNRNLECRIEIAVPVSGAGRIEAMLKVDFPLEDKSVAFTTAELESMLPALKNHEGEKDFMYVDSEGNVTTGVGFLLRNEDAAAGYPFVDLDDNPATEEQKRAEWRLISSKYDKDIKHTADWYEDFTELYLQGDFIDSKLQSLVVSDFSGLSRVFPGFGEFPSAARIAIHDMYYNLGASKLQQKFPSLMAAIARRDWSTAAVESHRTKIGEDRNDYVRDLFLVAATNQ